ncbi:MAG: Lrp/AsnC ligand binding domain-containing protein [Candidatus Hydrothermarchaeota archaeon]|jgi:DNA-binding Lrp family transcriptional regulator|nr:Lrp/AsnC ligand binding domain-containing protein [Candidatus Hydrothermarchaeota archaeon]
MVVAGVLIDTAPGKTKAVLDAARKIKGVEYAYAVFGRYDIVATSEDLKDIGEVADMVVNELCKLDGITKTETLIVADI